LDKSAIKENNGILATTNPCLLILESDEVEPSLKGNVRNGLWCLLYLLVKCSKAQMFWKKKYHM
jgi:hypothetical protein